MLPACRNSRLDKWSATLLYYRTKFINFMTNEIGFTPEINFIQTENWTINTTWWEIHAEVESASVLPFVGALGVDHSINDPLTFSEPTSHLDDTNGTHPPANQNLARSRSLQRTLHDSRRVSSPRQTRHCPPSSYPLHINCARGRASERLKNTQLGSRLRCTCTTQF